jgi:hypothetical protein
MAHPSQALLEREEAMLFINAAGALLEYLDAALASS